eukprot:gnl/TRDRNA2_/TRDRNA2_184796_c0_seq1.p1 gnl/TRDRNA2_/TRDRNA2_184796_c0~~gnl/TRDRNA2_/TRDRNA2_184796_c0_seq1.p1  ORF type:complete len:389 (+),score=102.95 gnl/TRDRNA2_/TRDRNA2_184796_c0_seq1:86-1252(+)
MRSGTSVCVLLAFSFIVPITEGHVATCADQHDGSNSDELMLLQTALSDIIGSKQPMQPINRLEEMSPVLSEAAERRRNAELQAQLQALTSQATEFLPVDTWQQEEVLRQQTQQPWARAPHAEPDLLAGEAQVRALRQEYAPFQQQLVQMQQQDPAPAEEWRHTAEYGPPHLGMGTSQELQPHNDMSPDDLQMQIWQQEWLRQQGQHELMPEQQRQETLQPLQLQETLEPAVHQFMQQAQLQQRDLAQQKKAEAEAEVGSSLVQLGDDPLRSVEPANVGESTPPDEPAFSKRRPRLWTDRFKTTLKEGGKSMRMFQKSVAEWLDQKVHEAKEKKDQAEEFLVEADSQAKNVAERLLDELKRAVAPSVGVKLPPLPQGTTALSMTSAPPP